MLRIRKILFPTDFSAAAEDAFSHATHLARTHDAEIHVFNVVSPYDDGANNPMEHLPLERTGADGRATYRAASKAEGDEDADEGVAAEAEEDDGPAIVYEQVRSTTPAKAIVDHAVAEAFDLVVMGTTGRRGLERLLSSGVAEEVVRQAPCPVYTVRAREEPGPGPHVHRILAPVDLSEQGKAIVRHARALAHAYDATLDLLHVVEDVPFPTAYGIDPLTPHLPDVQARAQEALEALATDTLGDTEHALHVTVGNAAAEIIRFAEEGDVDLIVMATHGRTGVARFLIGSVAEKVVRTAPCLVFTLKSFTDRSLLDDEADAGEASA
jgi:nucleotide-binding universal stress UspA family protein